MAAATFSADVQAAARDDTARKVVNEMGRRGGGTSDEDIEAYAETAGNAGGVAACVAAGSVTAGATALAAPLCGIIAGEIAGWVAGVLTDWFGNDDEIEAYKRQREETRGMFAAGEYARELDHIRAARFMQCLEDLQNLHLNLYPGTTWIDPDVRGRYVACGHGTTAERVQFEKDETALRFWVIYGGLSPATASQPCPEKDPTLVAHGMGSGSYAAYMDLSATGVRDAERLKAAALQRSDWNMSSLETSYNRAVLVMTAHAAADRAFSEMRRRAPPPPPPPSPPPPRPPPPPPPRSSAFAPAPPQPQEAGVLGGKGVLLLLLAAAAVGGGYVLSRRSRRRG